jgi:hypothetical protein
MSINRVVALLTPLVFAPLAGACAAWLAEHFPGAEVSADQLQQIFIAGALVALAPALQWLHGWQKHEARLAAADASEQTLPTVSDEEPELEPGDAEDEFDGDDDEFDLEFEDDAAVNGNPVASGA